MILNSLNSVSASFSFHTNLFVVSDKMSLKGQSLIVLIVAVAGLNFTFFGVSTHIRSQKPV